MQTASTAVVLLLAAATTTSAGPVQKAALPSFIKPCARTDPNFNDCALKNGKAAFPSFMKGDRKYNIPRMDPIEITEMSMHDGPDNAGFTLTMRDVKLYGLKKAQLVAVKTDFERKHTEYHTLVPVIKILGQYEIGGRILVLPISGRGDINITLVDNQLIYKYDFSVEPRKDGHTHLVTKNPEAIVLPQSGHYTLTNLFNGDKILGPQMQNFLNENFHDVYRSMSPALQSAFAMAIASIVDGISASMPYDLLFPEKLP